jgi:hypothetical protein
MLIFVVSCVYVVWYVVRAFDDPHLTEQEIRRRIG